MDPNPDDIEFNSSASIVEDFSSSPPSAMSDAPAGDSANKAAIAAAVARAQEAYEAAIGAQRSGDWGSFGLHLTAVGEALQDIENELS